MSQGVADFYWHIVDTDLVGWFSFRAVVGCDCLGVAMLCGDCCLTVTLCDITSFDSMYPYHVYTLSLCR